MVLRGYIVAWGIFLLALLVRVPTVGCEASPTPQTLAHLDSTRTPRQLVKRLGKHIDKQSQPHLNQLISKSILLPT